MILYKDRLFFTTPPKESEIGLTSNNFYFVKGTVGCRETHKHLYSKYMIKEVEHIVNADMIVMEWPSFKSHHIDVKTDDFKMNELFYAIEHSKLYFQEVEKIWKEFFNKPKISVRTFLSYFLSDREELTKDSFLDLYNKCLRCSTPESLNVLLSKIVNIDIKYKHLIGSLNFAIDSSSAGRYGVSGNTFFKKSAHSNIRRLSPWHLFNAYHNEEFSQEENNIIEQILDNEKDFFIEELELKKRYPHLELSITKKKKKEVEKPIAASTSWGDF